MFNRPKRDAEIENLNRRISELEQENASLRSLDEAISRNNALFEALVANSSAGIALTGPDRRIVRVVRAVLGYSRSEVSGVPLDILIHPADRGLLTGCYEELLSRRSGSVEFEGRFRRPDGSFGWVSAVFTDMLDDPNVHAIVCNYTDITQQKEGDLIAAEFAAMVESSEHAVFSEDSDGHIITWNARAEKLFGYSWEEISGRKVSLLVPPDVDSIEQRNRSLVVETRRPAEFPTARISKHGSRITVIAHLSPVLDRYGRPSGMSHCLRLTPGNGT